MTLVEVIDTLQTWIRNADDEYDREEMGRVAGLKEALHEIKKIEPCEDAISRKFLLDHAVYAEFADGVKGWVVEKGYVEDALTVQPQPNTGHWIPVSERLPEEKENPITRDFYQYPCTAKFDDNYDIRYYKFGNGHWWHGPGIMDEYVMAWMPLPEPYKAEKEE